VQGWLGISLPSLCLGIDVFELLLSLDRLEGNQLVMTQELIANMLGVRREGVTEGALKLQHAGLIQYARGHITVLDRAALEERSCECYAVVKKEYDRLLPVKLAS
jgi:Mn-dependent DtxR family transcriptional regulator